MYYRQPRYFGNFKCVGGSCSNSCCMNWSIDWVKEEIDKVKNAPECSQELKELCENSFKYVDERGVYSVILNTEGRCPFLTPDKFCKIQRELGAEYLSQTCTVYPRKMIMTDSAIYRCCHMTCPEIMKELLNDEKSMDLINVPLKVETSIKAKKLDDEKVVAKKPERKYAAEIKEFFYETIANKKLPLESCIILGALAAQSLTKLVAAQEYNRIPEAIKTLRAQMHNADQLKAIEKIKPNYNVKLGITDKLIREYIKSGISNSLIDEWGKPNIDIYVIAEVLLEKEFGDRPFAWRNMALNLLMELSVPFKLEEHTIFENYSVFVAAYTFIRHNALLVIGAGASGRWADVEGAIVRFNAMLSRRLCHNEKNLEKLLGSLREFKMTSPAYLALLVK